MRARRRVGFGLKILLSALVGLAMAAGTASAEVTEVPLQSATDGVAIDSTGDVWVAEQFASRVARLSPTGQILGQYDVGAEPLGVTAGPGGSHLGRRRGSEKAGLVRRRRADPHGP